MPKTDRSPPARFELPPVDEPLVLQGDALEVLSTLPGSTFQCAVTSPPYWGVRDYGVPGQIGAETDVLEYVAKLVLVFREVRRVLRQDGTLWLNVGNTYTSGGRKWRQGDRKNPARAMSYRPPTPEGLKSKDLVAVAWMLATGCQKDGWFLRNDIVWHKPNCQPESVRDRFTVAHEYVFLLSKSGRYRFDAEAAREPGTGDSSRQGRTVWSMNTEPCAEAHFAVFPRELARRCLLCGSGEGDAVLDPFFGAGTVGLAALELGRRCVGIELNPGYVAIARKRAAAAARGHEDLDKPRESGGRKRHGKPSGGPGADERAMP